MEASSETAERIILLSRARRSRMVRAAGNAARLFGAGSFHPSEPEWRAAETRRCVEGGVPFGRRRNHPLVVDRREAEKYLGRTHVAYLALESSACFRACLAQAEDIGLPRPGRDDVEGMLRALLALEAARDDWADVSRMMEKGERRERARVRLAAYLAPRCRAPTCEEEWALAAM